MSAEFVHLHVHTHYSLLDGAIKVAALVDKAKEFDMPAVAITDHGNMHGAVDFYKTATKAGIKPILGCEMYVAPGDRRDKETRPGVRNNFHLVLLSENETGFLNLIKLVSDAWVNGFYYKPRTDLEMLASHSKGLIGLSACLNGQVAWLLRQGREADALAAAGTYSDILGKGNFFIEIQDAGIKDQQAVNPLLLKLAKDLDLPAVATNDCHYPSRDYSQAHEALMAVQTGKTLADESRMKMESDQLYIRSPQEMVAQWSRQPELLKNTLRIAERCHVELDLKTHHFPAYPLPEGQTAEDEVRRLSREGLEARFKFLKMTDEAEQARYRQRLEHELEVICQMGFAGYFLVVADFITWAKEHDIPVGPGRGSAAGSLAAYAMQITDIEPIRYGLLFERFLNPERISMPDIDVDFCYEQREKVIQYVTETYGEDSVAQITTFGSMKAKAAIRDVGRVMGLSYGDVDRIAKLVPEHPKMTLAKAYQQEPRLTQMRQADPQIEELLGLAERLEGLNRHASTHAAGVVIAPGDLTDHLPIYKDSKTNKTVTQYDMNCVEAVGLIKFDFLGLRTLTVIDQASKLIRRGGEPDFDISTIPMDDKDTYDLLSRGDTTGVFQLESSGMKDMLVRFRPELFEHIIALVALYRPGPMENIPDFIARKFGRQPITYPHPDLEPVLKETYGIIVYQEQVMAIANILAGYSLGQADILRRAMGKKKVEVMEKERVRFVAGAAERGHPKDLADSIFDLIAKFAGYGFNKSHAAAYGLIAYQTAWLKTHHPVEFMAAQLTSWSGNTDQIVVLFSECKDMNIKVLPPDVNVSDKDFGVDGQAIRFGLAAVKNVGLGAIEAIVTARTEGGPFKDMFDFCTRVDLGRVNKRVLESLVKCGAFDSTIGNRAQQMELIEKAAEAGVRRQREEAAGQFSLFGQAEEEEPPETELPNIEDWPETTRLAFEKETLGFYVSGHPLSRFERDLRLFAPLRLGEVDRLSDKSEVVVAGLPVSKKEINTKKGDRMAFVQIEDLTGRLEVVVLPNVFLESRDLLDVEEPILISGVLDKTDSGLAVKANEIVSLSQAPQKLHREFRLFVDASLTTPEDLTALGRILKEHSGSVQVRLKILKPEQYLVTLEADDSLAVTPSHELYARVRELLGPGSVY